MRFSVIALLFCLLTQLVYGQQENILDRKISFTVTNQPVSVILKKIESLSGCRFSYPSGLLTENKRITLSVNNKSLRQFLPVLFGNSIQVKSRGKYIILSENRNVSVKSGNVYISGIISDSDSKNSIAGVSIYDNRYLLNALSDSAGRFRLKAEHSGVVLQLKFSKHNYQDTVIVVKADKELTLQITLKPVSDDVSNSQDFPVTSYLVPESEVIHAQNISDTIHRVWQFGVLPSVSTNGQLNSRSINNFSYNILGGYSLGTDGAEVGGLFNLNRGDARYFQLAGIGNGTGGSFTGFQTAGFANVIAQDLNGVQLSGFSNLVRDSVKGAQVAGFFNLVRRQAKVIQISGFANSLLDTSGALQFSGFTNFAQRQMAGGQISGFLNLSCGTLTGGQISGFANVAIQPLRGMQISGFANVSTRKITGVQLSGFANIAVEEMHGVQLAGFFNYAKFFKGVQFGVFNYADSCRGVPFGILSYVRSGYHRFEIATDELGYAQLAFRTGLHAWHTQIFAGIRPEASDTVNWTFGYGLGSTIRTGEKAAIDIDITGRQLVNGSVGPKIDLVFNFYAGLEYQIWKGIRLAGGPQLSAGVRNNNYRHYPERFGLYTPEFFSSEVVNGNTRVDFWPGWKVGMRF